MHQLPVFFLFSLFPHRFRTSFSLHTYPVFYSFPGSVAVALSIFDFNMFRSAIVRSLRASAPRAVKTPAPFQIRSSPIAARVPQFTPCFVSQSIRAYSAPAGLNKSEVEGRIVNLLKNFDKVRQNVIGRRFAAISYHYRTESY